VKRAPQAEQNRRRRIAELSSVGRESLTCVSGFAQYGHRMRIPSPYQPLGQTLGLTANY
jgi:hypothetical protein